MQNKDKKEAVYFGLYRMAADDIEKEFPKGYLNVYIAGMSPNDTGAAAGALNTVRRYGGKVWLSPGGVFAYGSPTVLADNWRANLSGMIDTLTRDAGLEDVLGFYFDEPLLNGVSKADYRTLTRFLRETWPEMRVMSIFAVNAIDPSVWTTGHDQVLDPETLRYTTDAGYDMYHDLRGGGICPYRKLNAALKERFGREDFRVWHVPCVMNYFGKQEEACARAHTEAMYGFLKEEKNPGGLMCYAYSIPNRDGDLGNVGLDEMGARPGAPWSSLYERVQEIGKEILAGNSANRRAVPRGI